MEKLEKFILDNRESMDTAVPSLKVWAEIDKQLERKSAKRVHLWKSLRVAAAVAVLITTGALGGAYYMNSQNQNAGIIANIAPDSEYVQLEQYYTQQISQKTKQLASLASYEDSDINNDLKRLDETFAELRREYESVPEGSGKRIIEAMLFNYKAKVEILERVLEKIQTNNPEIDFGQPEQELETKEDESVTI